MRIKVKYGGDVAVVYPKCKFVGSSEGRELLATLRKLIAEDGYRILLNMRDAGPSGSMAYGVLVIVAKEAKERCCPFAVCEVQLYEGLGPYPPILREALSAVRIFGTQEEALKALQGM